MVLSQSLRRILLSLSLILLFYWLFSGISFQPRYNAFSCPGYLTPVIGYQTNATKSIVPSASSAVDVDISLPDFSPNPYAYVFYATDPDYACSVLVNLDRLKNLFNTTHRVIVLVKPDLSSPYLTAFTDLDATVIPYDPPRLANNEPQYYHDVLLKLVAFRLHHYIPSLKRVLILDADQLILQSLDHVFNLPAVDVAAPRAYWTNGNGITSAFLLVSLSDRIWEKMSQSLSTIRQNVFDMDLVNEMFTRTFLILPGDYATLNSHWETNDIPEWWQGTPPPLPSTPPKQQPVPQVEALPQSPPPEQPPQEAPQPPLQQTPEQPPQPPSETQEPPQERPQPSQTTSEQPSNPPSPPASQTLLGEPPSTPTQLPAQQPSQVSNMNSNEKQTSNVKVQALRARYLEPGDEELRKRKEVYKDVLHKVYADVKVLHFTALGKPWTWPLGDIEEERPLAHELFKAQFQTWHDGSRKLCNPAWR